MARPGVRRPDVRPLRRGVVVGSGEPACPDDAPGTAAGGHSDGRQPHLRSRHRVGDGAGQPRGRRHDLRVEVVPGACPSQPPEDAAGWDGYDSQDGTWTVDPSRPVRTASSSPLWTGSSAWAGRHPDLQRSLSLLLGGLRPATWRSRLGRLDAHPEMNSIMRNKRADRRRWCGCSVRPGTRRCRPPQPTTRSSSTPPTSPHRHRVPGQGVGAPSSTSLSG